MENNFKTTNLSAKDVCLNYFQSLDTNSIYSVSEERINEIQQYAYCFRNYFILQYKVHITRQSFFEISTERLRTMRNQTIFLGTGNSMFFPLNGDGEMELFVIFATDPHFEYATLYNNIHEECRNSKIVGINAFKVFKNKMLTYENGFFCPKIIDLELKLMGILNEKDKMDLVRK